MKTQRVKMVVEAHPQLLNAGNVAISHSGRRFKRWKTIEVIHGVDCPKVPHMGKGYLHMEHDDSPYDVDGCKYCGRCHHALFFALMTQQKHEAGSGPLMKADDFCGRWEMRIKAGEVGE
jgi:hypothetical protein